MPRTERHSSIVTNDAFKRFSPTFRSTPNASAPLRLVQASRPLSTVLFPSMSPSRFHLPGPLCSTPVTALHRSYEASVTRCVSCPHRVIPSSCEPPSSRAASNHRMVHDAVDYVLLARALLRPTPRCSRFCPGRFGIRGPLAGSPSIAAESSSLHVAARDFPPVALHTVFATSRSRPCLQVPQGPSA